MLAAPQDPHALLVELCRRDFGAFLRKAWPHISGGEFIKWNWHIEAMVELLNGVASGATRRALVNIPPRNGKSKIISVAWVAWMLGRDPSLNFLGVSYSNELSGKMGRDCRSILEAQWYREMFPRTLLSRSRSASHDFETTQGGGRLSTSVSGTLTGRGGDIIILDDVIKPEEASSETVRKGLNEWFRSTLASRLNDKDTGAILCVMQRLHEDDLSGMLLEQGGWRHLALPAIAPCDQVVSLPRGRWYLRREGEVLHPARESRPVLDKLKAEMGSAAFAAQYQQDPVPAVGNMFRAEWLREYTEVRECNEYGKIVQSWDTANKAGERNDYSVCITARVKGREIRLLHVWRGKLEFPDLKRKAIELAIDWRARTLLIEDKASGQQLIQALRAEDRRGVPWPIARAPELDKYSRADGITSMVEAGQLLLPADAAWLAEFRSELLAFPNGRNDDQVDALSQLLAWARRKYTYPNNLGAMPEVPDEEMSGDEMDALALMDEGEVWY